MKQFECWLKFISLKFVSVGPTDNILAFHQRVAWYKSSNKWQSILLTHIYITQIQWVVAKSSRQHEKKQDLVNSNEKNKRDIIFIY